MPLQRRSLLAASIVLATCVALAALTFRAEATPQARITVYAAASLTDVFPEIDGPQRYSFGGSNTLAAQIEHGAPADVFASANTDAAEPAPREAALLQARRLHAEHARDRRAEGEPGPDSQHARPLEARHQARRRRAGCAGRQLHPRALTHAKLSKAVHSNVVSRENDVREVLSKVALGEADAGFVYSTDAKTVSGRVTVIRLPAWAQPRCQYGICVVNASGNKAEGQAFIAKVLSKAGQAKLVAAGFLPRAKPKPAKK